MAEAIVGQLPEKEKPELIYDEDYKHSLTATSYSRNTSLLSNVDGHPVVVEYYRGYQGSSEEAHGFQPNSIETYQSYTRIKGMIIKRDGKASFNTKQEVGVVGEQGIALMIYELAPLFGDVFIMNIGDGRAGLYQIEQPRILSLTSDKVYEVEYKLIAIMNPIIEQNLESKVIKELVYSKDKALRGGDAIITASEYELDKELYKLIQLITDDIYASFIYSPERTVVVPNDTTLLYYDTYLASFLQAVIDTRTIGYAEPITVVSVEGSRVRGSVRPTTVWDMFLHKQFNHPEQFKRDYYLHDRKALLNTRNYGGFYFSKLDKAITIYEYGTPKAAYSTSVTILSTDLKPAIEDQGGRKGTPYNYYFSDDFYTGNPTKSNEKFVFDFFRDQVVKKEELVKILFDYFKMEPIDRLYMSGIYLMAARIAVSKTYNYL